MTFLQLTDLQKRYGDVAAVSGVSLSLPAGSRTAIVGPSGSGKTTLLRLLAGFERPDRGRIVLDGTPLADGSAWVPAHLRGIGVVAQEGALFPHLNVADNIGFGMTGPKASRFESICALLDMVELDRSMLARKPDQLSGGQQQRVALARALARKPRLMLLDEPFSALDTGLRAATRKSVIEVLNEAGITTILVTHDQAEALAFGDRLGVMRDGNLVQFGSPRDVYLKPGDPITAAFLGDAIILPAVIVGTSACCALGEISVQPNTPVGAARILLRPEQLHIQPYNDASSDGRNGPIATVTSVVFSGASYEIGIKIISENEAPVCLSLNVSSWNIVNPGDRVHIDTVGDAHVF